MARTVNPEQQKKTRNALFLVAARAFLRDGYAATGMKALAAEAGCTTGKLYSNYSGKEELLTELLDALFRGNREAAERFAAKKKDPFYGVAAFLMMLYKGAKSYANLREIYLEGLSEPAGRQQTVLLLSEMLGEDCTEEELLRIRIAVRTIPAFLEEMAEKDETPLEDAPSAGNEGQSETVSDKDTGAERFYIGMLARILGKDAVQADAYADRISADSASLRERAYDVLVKLLQGPKKRNVKKM